MRSLNREVIDRHWANLVVCFGVSSTADQSLASNPQQSSRRWNRSDCVHSAGKFFPSERVMEWNRFLRAQSTSKSGLSGGRTYALNLALISGRVFQGATLSLILGQGKLPLDYLLSDIQ